MCSFSPPSDPLQPTDHKILVLAILRFETLLLLYVGLVCISRFVSGTHGQPSPVSPSSPKSPFWVPNTQGELKCSSEQREEQCHLICEWCSDWMAFFIVNGQRWIISQGFTAFSLLEFRGYIKNCLPAAWDDLWTAEAKRSWGQWRRQRHRGCNSHCSPRRRV